MREQDTPLREFDRSFREWANRPPSTTPARAAGQVLDRMDERRKTVNWWIFATAAATLCLSTVLLVPVGSPAGPGVVSGPGPVLLDGNSVLLWLDSETPLYLGLVQEDE